MKSHPRIRKTFKWGGAALTILLVVVWIGSAFRWAMVEFPPEYRLSLNRGVFMVETGVVPARASLEFAKYYGPGADIRWWPGSKRFPPYGGWYWMPTWIPLAMSLCPTAAAWRLDTLARRREREGKCPKCGYDRTGLAVDAVCPECGSKPA